MYLLDTCALLWWTLAPDHLSAAAAAACRSIESHGHGVLSAISIWEIGVKVKNGKLEIGVPIEQYHRRLLDMNVLEIVPVEDSMWLKNLSLDWDHKDPADRTIVALAVLRNLQLVTRDERIRNFYPRCVW